MIVNKLVNKHRCWKRWKNLTFDTANTLNDTKGKWKILFPLIIHTCGTVTGCSHIFVFIAGQKTKGFEGSQARATQVKILSHIPLAILPSVLASNGAIKNKSAHFTKSICNTGSPLSSQAAHSTVSDKTWIPSGSTASFKKCLAFSVTTTLTSKLLWHNFSTNIGNLIVATLPVHPIKTFFLEIHAILTDSYLSCCLNNSLFAIFRNIKCTSKLWVISTRNIK